MTRGGPVLNPANDPFRHVLYWWLGEPLRLSATARDWTEQTGPDQKRILISTVTLWELEYKRRAGKLTFMSPLREACPFLKRMPGVDWVSPSAEDWLLAAELDWNHRDPSDRLIAAIALNRGVPVLTKDERFHHDDSPVEAGDGTELWPSIRHKFQSAPPVRRAMG